MDIPKPIIPNGYYSLKQFEVMASQFMDEVYTIMDLSTLEEMNDRLTQVYCEVMTYDDDEKEEDQLRELFDETTKAFEEASKSIIHQKFYGRESD